MDGQQPPNPSLPSHTLQSPDTTTTSQPPSTSRNQVYERNVGNVGNTSGGMNGDNGGIINVNQQFLNSGSYAQQRYVYGNGPQNPPLYRPQNTYETQYFNLFDYNYGYGTTHAPPQPFPSAGYPQPAGLLPAYQLQNLDQLPYSTNVVSNNIAREMETQPEYDRSVGYQQTTVYHHAPNPYQATSEQPTPMNCSTSTHGLVPLVNNLEPGTSHDTLVPIQNPINNPYGTDLPTENNDNVPLPEGHQAVSAIPLPDDLNLEVAPPNVREVPDTYRDRTRRNSTNYYKNKHLCLRYNFTVIMLARLMIENGYKSCVKPLLEANDKQWQRLDRIIGTNNRYNYLPESRQNPGTKFRGRLGGKAFLLKGTLENIKKYVTEEGNVTMPDYIVKVNEQEYQGFNANIEALQDYPRELDFDNLKKFIPDDITYGMFQKFVSKNIKK